MSAASCISLRKAGDRLPPRERGRPLAQVQALREGHSAAMRLHKLWGSFLIGWEKFTAAAVQQTEQISRAESKRHA
jgi:hypothetical protein